MTSPGAGGISYKQGQERAETVYPNSQILLQETINGRNPKPQE
jgi:hypothetical protein